MLNPIDLLLNPTTEGQLRLPLKPTWVAEFFASGLLRVEHLLADFEGTPVWIRWIENNQQPQDAAALVVDKLSEIHFDWMDLIVSQDNVDNTVLRVARIFNHCNTDTLSKIFSTLSEDDLNILRTQKFKYGTSSVSILGAVYRGNSDGVKHLLQHGWDIEETNSNGETLLLQTYRWDQAKILLDNGANVLAVDNNNTTVLDRVQLWSSRASLNSSDISKILNTYMRQASPSFDQVDTNKKSAIITLFSQIGEEKTGSIKKTLAVLRKTKATSDDLVDVAGRSLIHVLRDQVFKHGVYGFDLSHGRFFSRFFMLLMDNHAPGGVIDLDRPFSLNPGLHDRDVLMMMMWTFLNNKNFNRTFITPSLQKNLNDWSNQRMPTLVPHLHDFFQPLMNKNNSPERLRELFVRNFEPNNRQSQFFSRVASHLSQLPFEHPIVEFILDNMIQRHKNQTFYYNNYENQTGADELRWGQWYLQNAKSSNTHPLVDVLDHQLLNVFGAWYLHSSKKLGEVTSQEMQGARTQFSSYIVQRLQHLDQINPTLLKLWRTHTLERNNVLALTDISESYTDSTVVEVLEQMDAQVLINTLEDNIGDLKQNVVDQTKRKL